MICDFDLLWYYEDTSSWQIQFFHAYGTYTKVDLTNYKNGDTLRGYSKLVYASKVTVPVLGRDLGHMIVAAEEIVYEKISQYNFRFATDPFRYEFFFEDAEAALMFKMQL